MVFKKAMDIVYVETFHKRDETGVSDLHPHLPGIVLFVRKMA